MTTLRMRKLQERLEFRHFSLQGIQIAYTLIRTSVSDPIRVERRMCIFLGTVSVPTKGRQHDDDHYHDPTNEINDSNPSFMVIARNRP